MHDFKQFQAWAICPVAGPLYRIDPAIRFQIPAEYTFRRIYCAMFPYSNSAAAVTARWCGSVVRWLDANGREILKQEFGWGHVRPEAIPGPNNAAVALPFSRRSASVATATASVEFDLSAGPSAPNGLMANIAFPNSAGAIFGAASLVLYPYELSLPAASVEIQPWFLGDAVNLCNVGVVAAVASQKDPW
jgi:hypothetical protein